ncbi:zinc finger protein ZOP1-like [Papaver somniferum]|uniref:zinc finger protein ZOP1-like n=1 Tax=Papaver somniferum TaxID=3469 RepID=UPI000E6FA046|nr:zinc finger protein ZOP1-like [Papaver somniferum]
MTEYWVSQGNKWCDFCKIYISNNPSSIRTHEVGTRHKDSVAKRLDTMRKDNVAKEKEQKEAARALEQIEAKAKRSYQKDLAAVKEVRDSNTRAVEAQEESVGAGRFSSASRDWVLDSVSGYYYNQLNGYYYDPNSGFYYSDAIGKWVTQEEAFAIGGSAQPKPKGSLSKKPLSAASEGGSKSNGGPAPGLVIQGSSLNPSRSVKGASSSVAVNKRKRQEEKKPKVVSKEEAAALKAREDAKKRMEEREKPLLGLYQNYRL